MQFQVQIAAQVHIPASRIQLLLNAEAGADEEPAKPYGCGWFDSSYELSAGLEVIENAGFCFAD